MLALIPLLAACSGAGDRPALDRLIQNGRYADAEVRARDSLARYAAQDHGDDLQTARILDRLVLALLREGQTHGDALALAERAIAQHQRSLAIRERAFGKDALEVLLVGCKSPRTPSK